MLILNQLFKLVKLINSEKGKYQLAFGFALGMMLGLMPGLGLHTFFFIFLVCIFRINLGALMLSWVFFAVVAFPFDPLFHKLGYLILVDGEGLHAFFTKLYNTPLMPWTFFNNTVMMGSFIAGLVLFFPSVALFGFLIDKYRDSVRASVLGSRFYKALKGTKIYALYKKYEGIKGMVS